MGLQHRLKLALRDAFARVVWYSGLTRLTDRLVPPRLTILYGHCVADEAVNGDLAPEMKLSEARLEELLRSLGRRFDFVTIGEGMARLAAGTARRSMVALSMDDGYVDNLTRLVPLLERTDARATVFLEAGPVVERRLGWLHTFEWLAQHHGAPALAEVLAATLTDPADGTTVTAALRERIRACHTVGALKRALKYDLPAAPRDAALETLAARAGCDRAQLVNRLYVDAAGARALAGSGRIEIGGHTIDHPVLATLPPDAQRAEIAGGREHLARVLGASSPLETFAYPYGRRWDFDEASVAAAEAAGFRWAVTTHAGTNTAQSDRFRLRRWPIEEGTPLYALGAEASGAFECLRRLGLDLVE